jgi:hypothetical protein
MNGYRGFCVVTEKKMGRRICPGCRSRGEEHSFDPMECTLAGAFDTPVESIPDVVSERSKALGKMFASFRFAVGDTERSISGATGLSSFQIKLLEEGRIEEKFIERHFKMYFDSVMGIHSFHSPNSRKDFCMNRKEAIAAMEALQMLSCEYLPGGVCDCKYGLKPEMLKSESYGKVFTRPMSEMTGCPELRDMISILEVMSDEDFERFLGMSNGMTFSEKEVDDSGSRILSGLKQELEKIKAEYRCHPECYDDMSFAAAVGVLETILKKYGAEEKVIEFSEPMVLPDGSAVMRGQLSLPKDHWIYERAEEPPAPFRMGVGDPLRRCLENRIVEAAKYAVQGATVNGEVMDFDPDALIQNLVVGLFGYCTSDGTYEGGLIPRCPECRERLLQVRGTGVYELYCPKCGHEEKG